MTTEKKTKVFLCGPIYCPEETRHLDAIAAFLAERGLDVFLSSGDGLEARLLELSCRGDVDADTLRDFCAHASHAIFAMDLYRIIEGCDCLVFNMNGRVPDEGGLFRTAIAFAAGKPLVIYKEDCRTAFHGDDNSMITGLTHSFSTVDRIENIPAALADAARGAAGLGNSYAGGNVPPLVRAAARLGNELCEFLRENSLLRTPAEKLVDVFSEIKRKCEEAHLFEPAANPDPMGPLEPAGEKPRVYCSGPLFCPEETGAMTEIAGALEGWGFSTFLPHRDGMEAFVMHQVNSAFANALIFRPFKKFINKSIFALDIYQIIEQCGGFVFNMNGRAPDEGGVVETAVAFAAGKPIVIFKSDRRSFFQGGDNPMLRGIMDIYPTIASVGEIHGALAASAQKAGAAGGGAYRAGNLPPRVENTIKFGRTVWNILRKIQFLKPKINKTF
jgi:nucleoside 2-deoxyribosyltransferase